MRRLKMRIAMAINALVFADPLALIALALTLLGGVILVLVFRSVLVG